MYTVKIGGREFPAGRMITIRIMATGQVTPVVPAVAAAMVNGGTATLEEPTVAETAQAQGAARRATGRGQKKSKRGN